MSVLSCQCWPQSQLSLRLILCPLLWCFSCKSPSPAVPTACVLCVVALFALIMNAVCVCLTVPRLNGHSKAERVNRDSAMGYDSTSMMSSELESSSFIDSEEDEDASRSVFPRHSFTQEL